MPWNFYTMLSVHPCPRHCDKWDNQMCSVRPRLSVALPPLFDHNEYAAVRFAYECETDFSEVPNNVGNATLDLSVSHNAYASRITFLSTTSKTELSLCIHTTKKTTASAGVLSGRDFGGLRLTQSPSDTVVWGTTSSRNTFGNILSTRRCANDT